MPINEPFADLNRASTDRLRDLAARLSEAELQQRVGEHWTVAIALAHLAFWDRRVLAVLDQTEREGKLSTFDMDVLANDISLPLWAVIPPREAARLAVETAQALDHRLENFPPTLLEAIYAFNRRWVIRALHRNDHLNEVDAVLKG
jgi:uncharacterized damage-inducible protein DinB